MNKQIPRGGGLKPCPKCNSEDLTVRSRCMGSYVAVNCNDCGYLDEGDLSEEYAIKGWNERAGNL